MLIRKFNKAIVSLLLSLSIFGEYRVYQYMVSPRMQTKIPSSFVVTSTLDPVSYSTYHGGQSSLRINLLKTWACKGNTSGQEICENPISRAINSQDSELANEE